jgi:inhibitor of cysteine peptidase
MRKIAIFTGGTMLILALFLISAGCTTTNPAGTITATTTAAPQTTVPPSTVPATTAAAPVSTMSVPVFVEKDTDSSVTAAVNGSFIVQLRENPTTGYMWNVSVTKGLEITNDSYQMDSGAANMTGVGGTHSWNVKAVQPGNQTFWGFYKRPWENTTGNETNYVLNVLVS